MPRVYIIPHHRDERLFSGAAALANDCQVDFHFHVLPPDEGENGSPLAKPEVEYLEVLQYLDRRKIALCAKTDDLIVAVYDGVLNARSEGYGNLFMAGAGYADPLPCTVVISSKFLSWEVLEEKFNYDLQRHALLHLLVCGLISAYTDVESHDEVRGCLLDFNGRLADFNQALKKGYYLCSVSEENCHNKVKESRYGNSIIRLGEALKYKSGSQSASIRIGKLNMKNNNYNGPFSGKSVEVNTDVVNVWHTAKGDINLSSLIEDLDKLRLALKSRSQTAEHDITIGLVAEAAQAAKKGDEKTTLAKLKAAGKWAFDVAKDIGVEVAAAAISKSMGLSA